VLATNTPDVLTETTADFGFALMMATARRIAESERFLRRGEWTRWAYDMFTGSRRARRHAGHPGHGPHRPGHRAARRAGLRHEGDLSQPQPAAGPSRRPPSARATSTRPRCCARPTTWCWCCPIRAASHHAIGAAELAQMKPTATLTNVARGGIVDDAALAQALRERRIAAAGLDVFEGEPAVHPACCTVPNVVLTPHIASATVATRRAMADAGRRQPDRA
jgi:gluconate 2-dehydrogenase